MLCHAGTGPEAESQARRAAKIAWAKMIRKVYEVDPLTCPECGAQMRVISLIEDPAVIERILSSILARSTAHRPETRRNRAHFAARTRRNFLSFSYS